MYLWYEYETERQWQREIIEKIRRSVNFDQGDIYSPFYGLTVSDLFDIYKKVSFS